MLLHQETWMNIRAFKKLRQGGSSFADIARETGCDWRTVKKYLAEDAPTSPPVVARRTHPPRVIEPYATIARLATGGSSPAPNWGLGHYRL